MGGRLAPSQPTSYVLLTLTFPRYRKMKERLGLTEIRKQANRMSFGEVRLAHSSSGTLRVLCMSCCHPSPPPCNPRADLGLPQPPPSCLASPLKTPYPMEIFAVLSPLPSHPAPHATVSNHHPGGPERIHLGAISVAQPIPVLGNLTRA